MSKRPNPPSSAVRDDLLAELARLKNKTLNEQETLLETFLASREAQCASEILMRSLEQGRSGVRINPPGVLLPWLG